MRNQSAKTLLHFNELCFVGLKISRLKRLLLKVLPERLLFLLNDTEALVEILDMEIKPGNQDCCVQQPQHDHLQCQRPAADVFHIQI